MVRAAASRPSVRKVATESVLSTSELLVIRQFTRWSGFGSSSRDIVPLLKVPSWCWIDSLFLSTSIHSLVRRPVLLKITRFSSDLLL
jgi:hypothetical protein